MGSDIILCMALIASFAFVIQFLLSILGSDLDTDMVEAAESNPQIAIQYKMVNQWKEIAGEQVKAFEHINLGNITVFDGGQNSTGNFLNNVVKAVAPALGVIDQLPIADTLKKLKGDDKK